MKQKLTNMKVRNKIMMMVVPTMLLVLLLGIISLLFLNKVNEASTTFATNVVPSVVAAEEINTTTSDFRINEYRHVLAQEQDEMVRYEALMDEHDSTIKSLIKTYAGLITNEEDEALIESIGSKWDEYLEVHKQIRELSRSNKTEEAQEMLSGISVELFDSLSEDCLELVSFNKTVGDNENAAADVTFSIASGVLVICIIAIMLILILVAAMVIGNLVKPIKELEEIAAEIAAENMDRKVSYESKDELGAVSRNFNMIVDRLESYMNYIDEISSVLQTLAEGQLYFELQYEYNGKFEKVKNAMINIRDSFNDTLYQISEASDQVATGAQQMAESEQALAEGATEQAGSIEELTATVENTAGLAENSAESTRNAYSQAQEFEAEAENSSKSMEELTKAMDRINETSQKIANIISEIEDIASQTNLLSLNASIEAARAGEAGRGFAVVADQIGKLASDSAKSAVNTRELIGQSIEEINNGNNITQNTADALKRVIDGIRLLAKAAKETSDMSTSQAEAMRQIEQGIEQISGVVQSNSASAQETSATSEELSAQSENLKALVEEFKLMER